MVSWGYNEMEVPKGAYDVIECSLDDLGCGGASNEKGLLRVFDGFWFSLLKSSF